MSKQHKASVSQATQDEALMMAKKGQKPGQTKEQTKLIALGIQKGIADYKKQMKSKQRDADKAKKKKVPTVNIEVDNITDKKSTTSTLPWCLLAISWVGFLCYLFFNQ